MRTTTPLTVTLVLATLWPGVARAADTFEAFPAGSPHLEFFLGVDGLGRPRYDRALQGDAMLGVGLTPRFGGFLQLSGASNEYFSKGDGRVAGALYGTPLSTRWVDLDLFLVTSFGTGRSRFIVTPMLELNLDGDPDMLSWGLYLRLGERFGGVDRSLPDDPITPTVDEGEERHRATFQTFAVVGAYYTIRSRHQILLEHDLIFNHTPTDGAREVVVGGIALGYNVKLGGGIDLLTQVYLDIPQAGERFAVGLRVGMVASVPKAVPPPPAPEARPRAATAPPTPETRVRAASAPPAPEARPRAAAASAEGPRAP